MAFIRSKSEERTGYQIGEPIIGCCDNKCDFVMVYRLEETTFDRIRQSIQLGYVTHFMTGISWGRYKDYLYGEYDGINHWDEAQTDRYGNKILHSPDVPYMVPTISFCDYITEKLKKVVDAGVVAIHVEEPEFWNRAGYSDAFKREFELYYRTPWEAPHSNVDAAYKCAKLKAYLYTRTIDRLSSSLKEYAKVKYNRNLRFYVPTHSLINYTQWKIVSPEGKLADIPSVDGCIAQVWTGTSREKNWYQGNLAERTFETAYLEYGVMQELVKDTGRKMWFLHDPIEDIPSYDWDDYRQNYLKTVTASLMHPKINTYEICPWPPRVFRKAYPADSPYAKTIPDDYATILNNNYNTLGTLEEGKQNSLHIGILTGDCQLYQREYPDCEYGIEAKEEVGTVLRDDSKLVNSIKENLFTGKNPNKYLSLKFNAGNSFPGFYSLALPLLKYGIPVRPVLLDNARRYTGYLGDYDMLIMSYEFMKPDYPDINNSIAQWVRSGGTLIYVGDGSDPFNNINSWWTGKYKNPAEHLFEMLEITPDRQTDIVKCGNGNVLYNFVSPGIYSYSKENADIFRDLFAKAADTAGINFKFSNAIKVERERYTVAACLDESISDEPLVLHGLFADMYSPCFNIVTEKILNPGENALLCNIDRIKEKTDIIGTSIRVNKMDVNDTVIYIEAQGADSMTASIRIKTDFKPTYAKLDGKIIDFEYEDIANTVLLRFTSETKLRKIEIGK